MAFRRVVFGMVAAGLVVSLSGCGGDGEAEPLASVTPTVTNSATATATPTPTVDPAVAARGKIMADYKQLVDFQSRGFVSNDPTYPYEQMMVGNALRTMKSVATAGRLNGTRYSGSVRFLKGSVVALNLRAKPATATVHGCVLDSLIARKNGKTLTAPPQQVSTETKMLLVGGRWKETESATTVKDVGGCTQ